MEKCNDKDDVSKPRTSFKVLLKTGKQLLRSNSVANLSYTKNVGNKISEEHQHLLERADEDYQHANRRPQSQKRAKQRRKELLETFSVSKLNIFHHGNNSSKAKPTTQMDQMPQNRYSRSVENSMKKNNSISESRPNFNLTNEEKLELEMVIATNNAADCGLW